MRAEDLFGTRVLTMNPVSRKAYAAGWRTECSRRIPEEGLWAAVGPGWTSIAGTPSGVLWYIIWNIAPPAAEMIGFVQEVPCLTTFRSGQGLNKHLVRGGFRVRIFFKRRRLRELANER